MPYHAAQVIIAKSLYLNLADGVGGGVDEMPVLWV
jgi:hypothetical protein